MSTPASPSPGHTPTGVRPPRRWLHPPVVATVLLTCHAALVGWSVRANYLVVDEPGFLASGVAHLETGTFHAYRVNPPLPRVLAAVPMLAAGAKVDHTHLKDGPAHRCETPLGRDFAAANGERYFDLVSLARLTTLGWSLVGGWVLFLWARDLHGPAGGLLALALWCFHPMVIALAATVVPDVPAAAAGLTASYAFRRYLHAPSWERAAAAGVLLGVAQLTKFTLLVLYPAWLAVWAVARWRAGPSPLRACRRSAAVGHLALAAGISLYVLSAGYGFDGWGTRLGEFPFVSRLFGGVERGGGPDVGNRFRETVLRDLPVPLPATYVRGVDTQRKDFEAGWRSYLGGEWRHPGWWHYYLSAAGVKWPVGTLTLIALGLLAAVRAATRPAGRVEAVAVWGPAAAVFALVSSQTGFNHHLRYVLPALPFLLVGAGGAVPLVIRSRLGRAAVVGLVSWSAVSGIAIGPHFLSYFNEPAGGPARGSEHLVDSNIDWGQDLLHLKRWVCAHTDDGPLYLAYFGALDPASVGLAYRFPPADLPPGRYAISVHFVRGGTFPSFDGRGGAADVPPGHFTCFQRLRPVATAGYSINIYDVSAADAAELRAARGSPSAAGGGP